MSPSEPTTEEDIVQHDGLITIIAFLPATGGILAMVAVAWMKGRRS